MPGWYGLGNAKRLRRDKTPGREAGEKLAEIIKPGNPQFRHDDGIVKLSHVGINESQSNRWQLEASVPPPISRRSQ